MTIDAGGLRRRIHLAAKFGGHLDFESVARVACSAERGLFDFLLLDGAAAPTMLSAVAAVTDRLGLVGGVEMTSSEPFGVARQFATLDHLSDGRAGWRLAIAPDADGDVRAEEFVSIARAFWDSWDPAAVQADAATGVYVDLDLVRTVSHRGTRFDVRGTASLPAGPQGHPILLQEANSAEDRQFGATHADVLCTPQTTLEADRRSYADVRARARGRNFVPKVFAAVEFVLGDTRDDAEGVAAEMVRYVRAGACDGFILVPPTPLDEFVDSVVPLLQEWGVHPTEYAGMTLRDHLGLPGG